jgi:hypothetical protein
MKSIDYSEWPFTTNTELAQLTFPPEHIPLTPPDMNPCPECKTELEIFTYTAWHGTMPELAADIICPNPMCNFKDEM